MSHTVKSSHILILVAHLVNHGFMNHPTTIGQILILKFPTTALHVIP